MLLPALLVYYMHPDSKKDFTVYGLLVLVYVLYLSFGLARSCWIGAACGLFMMWMFGTLRSLIWRRKGRVFLLVILAVGVSWWSVYVKGSDAVSPVAKRAQELVQVTPSTFTLNIDRKDIFQSLHQRLLMWDVSKEIFLNRPVLGAGVGNYQMAFAFHQPQTLLKYPNLRELKTTTNAPHNEILFQAAQGGIVGLGLFLFMFMVLFLEVKDFAAHKKEGDKKQLLQALFCGILGMLADNMLNISLHAVVPAFIFWWIVGAEVSGVGKDDRTIQITTNPATKAIAILVIMGSAAILLWQGVWFASEYYSFVGQKEIAAGETADAQKHLQRALDLYPANTEAGFKLGNLLMGQQNYEKALSVFEKTLSAASYYEEVYYHAALSALGQNDTKKAVHYLMDNLKLHPYHLQAYQVLTQLLHENIIYADDAKMDMLERGLALFPYETNLWLLVGEIYEKQGDLEKAKNTYLRGLTVDTLNTELLNRLTKLYPPQGQRPDVFEQARLLQQYRKEAERFSKLSQNNRRQLRTDVEAYIQKYPDDTNGPILLARVLSLSGNDIKAEAELESVLAVHPDDLWANLALSTLYYKAENLQKARTSLENALFYYPENQVAKTRLEALKALEK